MSEETESPLDLAKHEMHSQHRYESLKGCIKDLKSKLKEYKKMSVEDKVNINLGDGGMGGGGAFPAAMLAAMTGRRGDGDGFLGGGGLVAGLLLGALFGRNGFGGFGGGWGGDGVHTNIGGNAAVPLAVNNIESFLNQQTLGDIQGEIANTACQTQRTVETASANNIQTTLQQTIGLQNTLGQLGVGITQGFASLGDKVDNATFQLNTNLLTGLCDVKQTVTNDGDKTRALISSIETANLNRMLVEQAAEIAELRNEGNRRSDRDAIRIEMINNQNQLQAQQQQQGFAVNQLAGILGHLTQLAVATNSNINVGNTGAVTTGPQTASPVNIR